MGSSGSKEEVYHRLSFGLFLGKESHRSPRTRWKRHKEVEEFFVDFCRDYTHRADSKPIPHPHPPPSPSLVSITTDKPSQPAASTSLFSEQRVKIAPFLPMNPCILGDCSN